MRVAENEVIIDVKADTSGAEKALKTLESNAKDSGEKIGVGFSKAFKIGLGIAVAGVAAFGVALTQGIAEAIEQENALNDLNNALARTGQYSKEASADLEAFASQLQMASVYEDDMILSSAALIQSLGKLSTEGLKEATQATLDLAAGLNIDLHTATMMVGKAAAGEIGTFSRYGIAIKEGATNAETFANALRALEQFQGAAAAKTNTYEGSLTQLSMAFKGVLTELGNIIVKSPMITAAFKFIAGQLQLVATAISDFQKSGGFERMLTNAVDLASFFIKYLGPVFEYIYNRIIQTGQALGAFASAFVSLLTGDFAAAAEAAKAGVTTFYDLEESLNFAGTNAALGFVAGFKEAITNAPPLTEDLKNKTQSEVDTLYTLNWDGLKRSFIDATNDMKKAASNLVVQLRGTIATGVGSAFSAMGAALVKGENAFAAFGKAVLGMFGDLALQLGQFYLLMGLGNLWLNPGAAAGQLAAGAALMILGGALKALAGGGGGASAGAGASSGGGGAAAAPVGEATLTSNLEQEEQGPRTEVNVNIAGNVLDRRETGMEIADIINETFSTNGIVVAKGAVV